MYTKTQNSFYVLLCSFFVCATLLFPYFVNAYTNVGVYPEDQSSVFLIENGAGSSEYFGLLTEFPHTYEFEITATQPYKASLFIPSLFKQKNDVSMIIVKKEKEGGVVEVGRTFSKEQSWDKKYVLGLGMSFKNGGVLQGELEPGSYILEVSSPGNDGRYQLVWGEYQSALGYVDTVRRLFEILSVYDLWFTRAILSPYIFVPFITGLLLIVFFKRRKKVR